MESPNDLLNKYCAVRQATEALCAPLKKEDYIPQPCDFASPPKWHLAHTTWFFEEMILSNYVSGYKVYDKDFSFLFNSYYHTVGDRAIRSERGAITRPTVDEVYAYRHYVDREMSCFLSGEVAVDVIELVVLGLNHEQQHQELLLTDLKHTFSFNPTFPVYDAGSNLVADRNTEDGWIAMGEGIYEMGYTGNGFCFDNELGRHKVYLQPYQIANELVTNGAFIEFIEAGGYDQFRHWLDDGWTWAKDNKIDRPLYWYKINGVWHYYTLAGLLPVDKDAVLAHVSFYEAYAYASWKGCRLPTEFEWEAASRLFSWGKRWEWMYSAYLPYPGFGVAPDATGEYNGKFMINTMVLRGGSVATPAGHTRNTYRNFFYPHHRWQYTGIRLAK